MKVIYVSGKYTGNNPTEVYLNILKAEISSVKLFKKGWCVLTPHKNMANYEYYESPDNDLDYNFWIKCDLELLDRCDVLFMMTDWRESKGACIEREYAIQKNIPIFYEDDGYPVPQ
jgi:hypothetical protein